MLPLAPGANGQPPRPPTEESSWVTPAWTAASALAWPVPRVSWKCTPTAVPGQARRTASSSCTTRNGVVVPMVSPRQSWSAPAVTAALATSTVRGIGVRPSNGQSQAVAMMTSSEPPAPCARAAISPTAATASAVLRPALARLCPSEAETTYSRFDTPESTARDAPRGLATSADQCTSPQRDSSAATWSASASAGTAFGETNEVASIRRTPVATSASSISSLAPSGIGASSCSPSRMPTSRMSTAAGSTRSKSFTVDLRSHLTSPLRILHLNCGMDCTGTGDTGYPQDDLRGEERREGMTELVDARPPVDRGSAFANAPMGVALCTPDGAITDANAALAALLGLEPADLLGRALFDLIHPDDVEGAREAYAVLSRHPGWPMRHECRFLREDGTAVPVQIATAWVAATPDGGPAHLVMIVEDITDRKALEAALVHRSLHDPLTGLPNRILFHDRLRHALDRGHRERTPTCVLIIDLDGFKAINDEHGHPMGDAVLVGFAGRLTSVLRASDTAARLGGDEFAVVWRNTGRREAGVRADRGRTRVPAPLLAGAQPMAIGMSIGI